MATIAENLQVVRARIARAAHTAGREPGSVTLLAVSKSHPASLIEQARAAGQRAFGENYVQEALQKMDALPELDWHLIGPLQANKTRLAAERFAWIHSLERERIARRLSEQRPRGLEPLSVLIQVNVSGEASKSGVSFDEIEPLASAVRKLPRLQLRGLMAIPEPHAPPERYREIGDLFASLKARLGFDTLSMGMSDDMEAAIAAGATLVRVGTAIFGQRSRQRSAA